MRSTTTAFPSSYASVAAALLALGAVSIFSAAPALGQVTSQVVVKQTSAMRYFEGRENPPADWTELNFDDSGWIDGKVPVGYGESTIVPPNATDVGSMLNQYLAIYVRIPFTVTNVPRVSGAVLRVEHDDGVIVFLNGTELVRASMPAGAATFQTAGIDHERNVSLINLGLNATRLALLREGTNVLSAQVHNTSLASSDLYYLPTLTLTIQPEPPPTFVRGADCDGRPDLDIGDPVHLLRWKFGAFYAEPGCVKACDMTDNGVVDVGDAIAGLMHLFAGGPALPPPYPAKGEDTTTDTLTCVSGQPVVPGD